MLLGRLDARMPTHVVTLNPEMVVASQRDDSVRQVLLSGDVFVADGVGLTWAAQRLGHQHVERYPGVDLALDLMRALPQRGGSVFLLGSRPGVAELAAQRLREQVPGLAVCGAASGYYTSVGEPAIAANIAAARPDLLLVGMGCPKQEEFISRYRSELYAPLMIGVGGSLEVFSGLRARAPEIIRRCGMEWAYRSILDISRMKRLGVLPRFVLSVLRQPKGGPA